jgi:hypothetical protein
MGVSGYYGGAGGGGGGGEVIVFGYEVTAGTIAQWAGLEATTLATKALGAAEAAVLCSSSTALEASTAQ